MQTTSDADAIRRRLVDPVDLVDVVNLASARFPALIALNHTVTMRSSPDEPAPRFATLAETGAPTRKTPRPLAHAGPDAS